MKSTPDKILAILITQFFVFLAWIPFRVRDFDQALYAMQKYLFFDFQTDGILPLLDEHKLPIFLIGLFIVLHTISYRKHDMVASIANFRLRYWAIIIVAIISSIIFLYDGNPQDFMYFRF